MPDINELTHLFEPNTIAFIGASADIFKWGFNILHQIVKRGFEGEVYPVNPNAHHVQAVSAFPTVIDIPDKVELAIVAVPAVQVIEVARQCAEKGVKGLVVISAGFSETDDVGRARQHELVEICRAVCVRVAADLNERIDENVAAAAFRPVPAKAGRTRRGA